MANNIILPSIWSEWVKQVAEVDDLKESAAIIRAADAFASKSGMSCESAIGMLAWLGSVAALNFTSVSWESGVWHPSAVTIAVVERDDVPIDSITSGFIKMVKQLGLDPIQDTVKEGPSGLISRLESSRSKPLIDTSDLISNRRDITAFDIASMDTSDIEPSKPENIGNVRGLIYPSGRAFMSYLYDTPFFNSLDEMIQHGSLNVRGKLETHTLKNINIAAFLPFYQGALSNLLQNQTVQSNMNLLLRQLLVLWPTPNQNSDKRQTGKALDEVSALATNGLKALEAMMPSYLDSHSYSQAENAMFDVGVGVRYVSINRMERLTRLAVPVMFWRIAAGSTNFSLTKADYAIADTIMHAHEMGSRLVEIATSKGKVGNEALKMFVSLHQTDDGDRRAAMAMGISQMTDTTVAVSALELLSSHTIVDQDYRLAESYSLVDGDVIRAHRTRWDY